MTNKDKELNLSEKSINTFKNLDGVNVKNVFLGCDVKEFIKIVEADYQKEWDKATDNNSIIDKNKLKEIIIKRAGYKLKEKKHEK